jgi:hypothetical protein
MMVGGKTIASRDALACPAAGQGDRRFFPPNYEVFGKI